MIITEQVKISEEEYKEMALSFAAQYKDKIQRIEFEKNSLTSEELYLWFHSEMNWCTCGSNSIGLGFLLNTLSVLNIEATKEYPDAKCKALQVAEDHLGRDALHFVIYVLDSKGLTDHGSSLPYCWLSGKGKAVLEALKSFGTEPEDWASEKDKDLLQYIELEILNGND